MIPEVLDALKTFFSNIWTVLQLINVPGTNISAGTVLVAPFGFAVFVTALKKILNLSAHDGVSDVANNTYKRYQKGEFDD